MSNFRPIDRETGFLFPPSIDDWLPEKHLARFVVEVPGRDVDPHELLGESQAEAARWLGVTQPRLNDLLRGRVDKFSLDALVNLAGPAGLTVRIEIDDAA